ncbi:MAG: hypothetical protein ACI9R3_002038 [Verrucomicrobiales bacterium]|jgi:hypothetical protein
MTEAIGNSIFHGLIGLLGAVLLLEIFVRWKRNREIEPGILLLLTVAAIVGVSAGAAYYLLPTPSTTIAAAPHWPAGCLFGLGLFATFAFYFKRRHRDIYLFENERPTCFKTNVMKHRRHVVEGNMQMGYTAMLFLATASLAAGTFIGGTNSPGNTVVAVREISKDKASKDSAPRTMAELMEQSDNETDDTPAPEATDVRQTPVGAGKKAHPEPDASTAKKKNAPSDDMAANEATSSASPEPEPMPASMSTIGNPKDFNLQIKRPKNIAKNVFASHIRPVLSKNCFNCHGKEKQKSGLRLDTLEGIRKGGKGGSIIVAGDPEQSTLYTSTVLPADDPDIMPAKGDPLVKRDTELLRKWILYGADLGDGKHIADASSGGAGFAVDQKADGIPLPEASLLENLKANGVHVRAVSANQSLLDLDFTHLDNKNKLNLKLLAPIVANVHALDLTRSKIKDADLAIIGQMKNLVRLQLNQTSISDEGLRHLKTVTSLENLNLYGTKVTDAGLEHLSELKDLQKLYLWESKATEDGGNQLKAKLPKLKVIF